MFKTDAKLFLSANNNVNSAKTIINECVKLLSEVQLPEDYDYNNCKSNLENSGINSLVNKIEETKNSLLKLDETFASEYMRLQQKMLEKSSIDTLNITEEEKMQYNIQIDHKQILDKLANIAFEIQPQTKQVYFSKAATSTLAGGLSSNLINNVSSSIASSSYPKLSGLKENYNDIYVYGPQPFDPKKTLKYYINPEDEKILYEILNLDCDDLDTIKEAKRMYDLAKEKGMTNDEFWVPIGLEDEGKIYQAKEVYDKLTSAQKSILSPEIRKILEEKLEIIEKQYQMQNNILCKPIIPSVIQNSSLVQEKLLSLPGYDLLVNQKEQQLYDSRRNPQKNLSFIKEIVALRKNKISLYFPLNFEEIRNEGYTVQGISNVETSNGDFLYVSAYREDDYERIYVYSSEGYYVGKFILNMFGHAGGVTIDKKNNVLYLTDEDSVTAIDNEVLKKYLENRSFEEMVLNPFEKDLNEDKKLKLVLNASSQNDLPYSSSCYFYDNYMYIPIFKSIGSKEFKNLDKSDLYKYKVNYIKDDKGEIVNIKYTLDSKVMCPNNTQGLLITEYKGRKILIISRSYRKYSLYYDYQPSVLGIYDITDEFSLNNETFLGYFDANFNSGIEGIDISESGEVNISNEFYVSENYSLEYIMGSLKKPKEEYNFLDNNPENKHEWY